MNVEEFRKSENLVSWMMKTTSNKAWSHVLEALEQSHPRREDNDKEANLQLGIIKGFDRAIDLIKQLSVPITDPPPVESTFGVEDDQSSQETK